MNPMCATGVKVFISNALNIQPMSTLLNCPVQVVEAIQRANSRHLSRFQKLQLHILDLAFGTKSRLQRNRDIIATRKAYVKHFETLQSFLQNKIKK